DLLHQPPRGIRRGKIVRTSSRRPPVSAPAFVEASRGDGLAAGPPDIDVYSDLFDAVGDVQSFRNFVPQLHSAATGQYLPSGWQITVFGDPLFEGFLSFLSVHIKGKQSVYFPHRDPDVGQRGFSPQPPDGFRIVCPLVRQIFGVWVCLCAFPDIWNLVLDSPY